MADLQTVAIDGVSFQTEQLDFDRQWSLFVKLADIVGVGARDSIAGMLDATQEQLGAALLLAVPAGLLRHGSVDVLGQLFASTYAVVSIDGKEKRQSLATAEGRRLALRDVGVALRVVKWVLEVNYSDSFGALTELLGGQKPSTAP